MVARSTRKCKYGMNGLKYDLKLNFIKEANFFHISKNVMNLYGFKELFLRFLLYIYHTSFENQHRAPFVKM